MTPLDGKKPKLSGWQDEPFPSLAEVERWAIAGNIGVRTGTVSGVIGIDDDTPDGSGGALLKLPETVTAITGSGKRHYYLKAPGPLKVKNSAGKLAQHVDVRGENGQLVFPGSIHPETGEAYKWAPGLALGEIEIAAIPPGLLRSLLGLDNIKKRRKRGKRAGSAVVCGTTEPGVGNPNSEPQYILKYAEAALQSALDKIRAAPEGERNDTLNKEAFGIGQLIGAKVLEFDRCHAELTSAATHAGLDASEIEPTIQSGLLSGIAEPRDLEPLKDRKREHDRNRRKQEGGQPGAPRVAHSDGDANSQQKQPGASGRVEILVSTQFGEGATLGKDPLEIFEATVGAMEEDNAPPNRFMRGGNLVQIAQDSKSQSSIRLVDRKVLRRDLLDLVRFERETDSGRSYLPASTDLLESILGDWGLPFPELVGLVGSPVVRPDWTIVTKPGFDVSTGLYYSPPDGFVVSVPDAPTEEELRLAVELVHEPFADFPFEDEASKANALALLITPFIRSAIAATSPMGLVDAPQQGTGKSLLISVIAQIATGCGARLISPDVRDDMELDKQVSSALFSGAALILLDNIKKRLQSATLESLLTTPTWSRRILGHNTKHFEVRQQATIAATGNNLQVGSEIARRSILIRLDALSAAPEQRADFRHRNLLGWVTTHRSELVRAVLVMVRAWCAAGRPEAKGPAFGSYEVWTDTVGGILAHAGISGFLANREKLRGEADAEREEWERFLRALMAQLPRAGETAREIVVRLQHGGELEQFIPEDLAGSLNGASGPSIALASCFRRRVGRRVAGDGLRIEKGEMCGHLGVLRWKVVTDA